MDVSIMPVLIVFLFANLFGGAIAGSTGDYLQFLLPRTPHHGAVQHRLLSASHSTPMSRRA